jgi:hypothetical protein
MAKAFASQADLEEKKVTWTQLSENAYAYTAEGDPNSGVIIGDDGLLIVDTTATPAMAQDLIARSAASPTSPSNTSCCRITTRCACSGPPRISLKARSR